MVVRAAYFAGFLLLSALYHVVLDASTAGPDSPVVYPWWIPYDLRTQWTQVSQLAELARAHEPLRLVTALLLWLPPLGMGALGLWLFDRTRPVARCACLALALLVGLFAYYGILAPDVWKFFRGQFVAVAAAASCATAVGLLAPRLLASALARPIWAQALAGAAFAAAVFLPSTEITGADASLPFGVSPWPALTSVGYLRIGLGLAVLHLAAGVGAYARARLGPQTWTLLFGVGLAGLLGAGCASLVFLSAPMPAWGAFGATAAAWAAISERAASPRARVRAGLEQALAGLLLGGLILGSDAVARAAELRARDVTAPPILQAIEAYQKARGRFPVSLDELIPEFLPAIPQPRIGLIADESDRYRYASLGDSYALEFTSVQFVQCQYSSPPPEPPAEAAANEPPRRPPQGLSNGDREAQEHLRALGLGGTWSCKRCPTKLW